MSVKVYVATEIDDMACAAYKEGFNYVEQFILKSDYEKLEARCKELDRHSIAHAKFCDNLDKERLEMISKLQNENNLLKKKLELCKKQRNYEMTEEAHSVFSEKETVSFYNQQLEEIKE